MSNETVELYGWQEDVIAKIEGHENARDSEQYQGAPEWVANKDLAIAVFFPRGSGHTYLANYVASEFPSILVYRDHKHLKEVTAKFDLHPESQTVSMYEIFYALFKPDVNSPSEELLEMQKRFQTDKVIVVDNALRVSQHVKDFIFANAQGPVVLLGH